MPADRKRPQEPRTAERDRHRCDRDPCPWSTSIFHVITALRPRDPERRR